MKFIEVYNYFQDYPLLEKTEVKKIFPNLDDRRFYEWQQKGHLKKIANNFYVFQNKKLSGANLRFIANRLYRPSYLSLEFALDHYSLIPEAVFGYTSVTTRKTESFYTDIGNFYYQKIKKDLFFGYNIINEGGINYKLAEPEKALLDFLYLRSDIKTKEHLENLRIDPLVYKEELNEQKLKNYLDHFNSKTLKDKINKLNSVL